MINYFQLFMLGCVLLAGCTDDQPVTLEKEKMVAIMIDLEYAKAATHGKRLAVKDSMMLMYKKQICEIHGITKETLDQNLDALENDQDLLEELLRTVKDSLSIEK